MHKPFFCLIFALAKAIDHEAPSFGSTIHRGVEQLAARRAHNPEVGGSSPPPATTADVLKKSSAFFVLLPGPCRALFLPRELDFCFDVRIFENGRFHVFFPCTFGVKSTKSLRTSFSVRVRIGGAAAGGKEINTFRQRALYFLPRMAGPDLVPMAKERPEG